MDEKMPPRNSIPLTDVLEQGVFIVESISDDDAARLKLLIENSIVPGVQLRVRDLHPDSGYSVSTGRSRKVLHLSNDSGGIQTCQGRVGQYRRNSDSGPCGVSILMLSVHWPGVDAWLKLVVEGYFRYYAVPTNLKRLSGFRAEVCRTWIRTLRRRSQRPKMNWDRFNRNIDQYIPRVRVCHPYPDQRFKSVTSDLWQGLYAVILPVWI